MLPSVPVLVQELFGYILQVFRCRQQWMLRNAPYIGKWSNLVGPYNYCEGGWIMPKANFCRQSNKWTDSLGIKWISHNNCMISAAWVQWCSINISCEYQSRGYDTWLSKLHQLSGAAQWIVMSVSNSWPNTVCSIIYQIMNRWTSWALQVMRPRELLSSIGGDEQ